MRIFYIPDGHRRYAEAAGCTLVEAYERGYDVLLDEIIVPLFTTEGVENLDIFLLSSLNLRRRDVGELDALIQYGTPMLHRLIEASVPFASVRTVGTYLPKNIEARGGSDHALTLVLGSTVDDDIGCPEADLFIRSGGEIRLSGAPRTIVGNYTQFYGLPQLHPELRFADIRQCVSSYRQRYMRRTDAVDVF